jgi:hypothetical protein
MATWPGTLPTIPLRDSYLEGQQQGSAIRSPEDHGPPKQRNRFTAAMKPFRVAYEMTGAQLDTFWTFYRTTLGNGALTFDGLPHPRTQAAVIHRFNVDNPPSTVPSGWDSYIITMNMEQMP